MPFVLVGHVTKDGALAGPRVLEHLVDTVITWRGTATTNCGWCGPPSTASGPPASWGFSPWASRAGGVTDPHRLLLGDRRPGTRAAPCLPAMEGQPGAAGGDPGPGLPRGPGRAPPVGPGGRRRPPGPASWPCSSSGPAWSSGIPMSSPRPSGASGSPSRRPTWPWSWPWPRRPTAGAAARRYGGLRRGRPGRRDPPGPPRRRRLSEAARLGFRRALVPASVPTARRAWRPWPSRSVTEAVLRPPERRPRPRRRSGGRSPVQAARVAELLPGTMRAGGANQRGAAPGLWRWSPRAAAARRPGAGPAGQRGALIVVGDDADVLSICTGGFLLDAEFTPQRLSELAKLDGAIILSADAARIARANVHLMPKPSIATIGDGDPAPHGRAHGPVDRRPRHLGVGVHGGRHRLPGRAKHVLQSASRLHERIGQALQTLERFRQRLDAAVGRLSALEMRGHGDRARRDGGPAPAELAVRIADEIDSELVELGDDARLLRLQLEELLDGVVPRAAPGGARLHAGRSAGRRPPAGPAWHRRPTRSARRAWSGPPGARPAHHRRTARHPPGGGRPRPGSGPTRPRRGVEPRGYRLLHRLPRFPEAVIDGIVEHFAGLQKIMRASWATSKRWPAWGRPGPSR